MTDKGIYLYGYFGQGNLGDDLLLESALAMLRQVLPDAPVFIHCHDEGRVQHNPSLHRPVPANALLAAKDVSRLSRLSHYFSLLRATFKNCRALVFGGGTVFQDSTSATSLLLIVGTVALAKSMGLSVIMLGSGIGALQTTAGRMAMRIILRLANSVCLRDARSVAIAQALYPSAKVRLTADLVFALPPRVITVEPEQAEPKQAIALSIQPSITGRDDQCGRDARAALCAVITWAIEHGHGCDLLAFETKLSGSDMLDDRNAWLETASHVLATYPDKVSIHTMEGNLDSALAVLQRSLLHVGMRYHGHVLSALAGLPFVGLAHDVKLREICRVFSMPCHEIDATAQIGIVHSCRDTLDNTLGREPDAAAINMLQQAAHLNVVALRDALAATP